MGLFSKIKDLLVDDEEVYETKEVEVEEKEEEFKIVSLDTALSNIAKAIGENSQYKVKQIELGYDATIDYDEEIVFGKPAWIIYADNESDTRETRFYVDVRTGEVHARVME